MLHTKFHGLKINFDILNLIDFCLNFQQVLNDFSVDNFRIQGENLSFFFSQYLDIHKSSQLRRVRRPKFPNQGYVCMWREIRISSLQIGRELGGYLRVKVFENVRATKDEFWRSILGSGDFCDSSVWSWLKNPPLFHFFLKQGQVCFD